VTPASAKHRSRPHTAFVLSGGASLGALQVGMLRAVYESGIAADLLVGTSAGALNAAFLASRPQTVATANELARVWCGLQREDIFPVSMRALVGGLCGRCDTWSPTEDCAGSWLGMSSSRTSRMQRFRSTSWPSTSVKAARFSSPKDRRRM
jgi:NTE family protein